MQGLENWDDVRFFLAVGRSRSLAAAARELGVNASTVFRRVGHLEEALGARLFDRQARGYALTPAGEAMMKLAVRVEDDVFAIDRGILGADRELRGTIRLTTVDEVLERLAPHLKTFRDRYREIHLQVSIDERLFRLSQREADVALRAGRKPSEPDIIARKLVSLRLAAYASNVYLEGCGEARGTPRSIQDLAGHDLIGFNEERRGFELWTAMAASGHVVYRANNMRAQAIAIRNGLGIGLLPTFMADPDPSLRRLFPVEPSTPSQLWLLTHADLRQTARVRAFVQHVTAAIASERDLYERG